MCQGIEISFLFTPSSLRQRTLQTTTDFSAYRRSRIQIFPLLCEASSMRRIMWPYSAFGKIMHSTWVRWSACHCASGGYRWNADYTSEKSHALWMWMRPRPERLWLGIRGMETRPMSVPVQKQRQTIGSVWGRNDLE